MIFWFSGVEVRCKNRSETDLKTTLQRQRFLAPISDRFGWLSGRPKATRNRPRAAKERSKSGQERPKSGPRAGKNGPRADAKWFEASIEKMVEKNHAGARECMREEGVEPLKESNSTTNRGLGTFGHNIGTLHIVPQGHGGGFLRIYPGSEVVKILVVCKGASPRFLLKPNMLERPTKNVQTNQKNDRNNDFV